ncbi:2,4'-dihydroxyacetophenone dioxygenase family protein [Massilia niastensis]|uniref:2,4'-dihydroxyacetophenone dioxygenase family protein n=1 Tax=Massilia niastensis TaxID=544911 RepID=UPI0003791ADC|nr:2,4'-dihydroxyacetophenone dioxygenase family protein [Massilia niastensis]
MSTNSIPSAVPHLNTLPFVATALHVGTDDLPFADDFGAPGVRLKLLAADIESGMFAVRIRFAPGVQLPPHHHTGAVHAFTLSGEWTYLEHKDSAPSTAGSYLYEPPGTAHTLKIADHNTGETDVFFVIFGAMLILDEQGNIVAKLDAESHLRDWPAALLAQGKQVPAIIQGGRARYAQPARSA